MKKWLRYAFFGLCGMLGATLWQGWQLESRQPHPAVLVSVPPVDPELAVQRLSEALQAPSVSYQAPTPDQLLQAKQAFGQLHQRLKSHFPRAFQQLKTIKSKTFGHSLLLQWPGSNVQLKPILWAAHQDVVPVENPQSWQQPPFSGQLDSQFVWGRGALDDKGSLWAILEAVEAALKAGFQPQHSLYLAFGADEEVSGQGAQAMAAHLQAQGVQLEGVLDEGMVVVPGSMMGLQPPVALIGIAEKGYLTVGLKVEAPGGHASMPAQETAVDILAQALTRLRDHPLPARLEGPAAELFDWLAPEMSGLQKWVLANRTLFAPLLLRQLSDKPSTSALIRTSMAPTMLKGSPKENVLAAQAEAVINLRILPGDTPEGILAHFEQAIHDPRVQLIKLSGADSRPASPVSSTQSLFFKQIAQTARAVFPGCLAAPSLVLAATDSRYYQALAENVYRFQPVYLEPEDLDRLHGKDERIAKKAHLTAIQFYQQLLQQL